MSDLTKLEMALAQRDALVKALHIFLPPGNEPMEDIIWEDQPDDALMTIRVRFGQFKKARAALSQVTRPRVSSGERQDG